MGPQRERWECLFPEAELASDRSRLFSDLKLFLPAKARPAAVNPVKLPLSPRSSRASCVERATSTSGSVLEMATVSVSRASDSCRKEERVSRYETSPRNALMSGTSKKIAHYAYDAFAFDDGVNMRVRGLQLICEVIGGIVGERYSY